MQEILKEQEFLKAVMEGAEDAPLGQVVEVSCPCGGKIRLVKQENSIGCGIIAKCQKCQSEVFIA